MRNQNKTSRNRKYSHRININIIKIVRNINVNLLNILLTDILKIRWRFQGFLMSDWGAVHSAIPDLFAGTDV